MKCVSVKCSNEAKKGFIYCSECWKKICERSEELDEKNEDQNVPEENTGQWPW